MDHFTYRNGELHAEDVPVAEIAGVSVHRPMFIPGPPWSAITGLTTKP